MLNVAHNLVLAAENGGAGLWSWLLGLERIDPTDASVWLGWRHALPVWVWLLIAAAVIGAAALSYRRLMGARAGRSVLAAVRAGLLLALAVLLAGPMLVLPRETVEPDRVLMLVDRSESMTVRDLPAGSPDSTEAVNEDEAEKAQRTSRDAQLRKLLSRNEPVWKKLSDAHRTDWLTFAERLTPAGGPGALGKPNGSATAMRSAIREAVRGAAGQPISGVVLFSDGRSGEPIGPETWRMLQRTGAAVFPVPLGSAEPPMDLAVQRLDAPNRAFVDDTVPVEVSVRRTGEGEGDGDEGQQPPPGTRVRLIDEATGKTLDRRPVEQFGEPVRLMTTPEAAGRVSWRVEVSSDRPELIERNNRRAFALELVDRPIRVLYVDSYPRWQYRYLKNMLIREKSIDSSIMLTQADRAFAQEGDTPLERLPRSEEEMRPFDVVILGDTPANFFSNAQLALLREQVSARSAGLMWIAGPRFVPKTYAGSSLAPLLPMRAAGSLPRLSPPVELRPTPIAEALGVLRMRATAARDGDGAASAGWPSDLPRLRWAQAIESIKPAAEPLAIDAGSGKPLVLRMRYGAGQTMYVATDETWRWRYGRGAVYGQQFWMQLIRLMARSRLQSGAGGRAQLTVSHHQAATGQTLVVELRINDQTLLDSGRPERVTVRVAERTEKDRSGPTGPRHQRTLTLTPTGRDGQYRGTWSPRVAGKMKLSVTDSWLSGLGLARRVTVRAADDEMRYPATDHAALAELAERTEGRMVPPGELGRLPELLPNRARRTATDIREPLAHSPLALIVLLALLTGEWIGRRLLGLA